ncbi:hypothetical protein IH879_03220 [candidate division KSB1 bacterium]|nr:hypothetical protein [candidate division KSB1 bacterium]
MDPTLGVYGLYFLPGLFQGRFCLALSRIIQVCDVFDALISARPFRPAKTREQALEIIDEMAERGEIQTDRYKFLQPCIQ